MSPTSVRQPSAGGREGTKPPTTTKAVPSIAAAAWVAGAGLVVMSALAGFGHFGVVQQLVAPSDPAATADAILGAERFFRLGVMALYLAALLDVVVAAALYRIFSPVSVAAARLEAWLRLAYAAVFVVAISQLAGIPDVLKNQAVTNAFTPAQVQAQALQRVEAFHDIWFGGLLLFGAHLMVLGYVAYRSGYLPRLLAALVAVAGAGYAVDTATDLLSTGEAPTISSVTFAGEFLLAVWLLVRARHIAEKAADHAV